jgi:hypothetical protein
MHDERTRALCAVRVGSEKVSAGPSGQPETPTSLDLQCKGL